jgi:hypothetical protein
MLLLLDPAQLLAPYTIYGSDHPAVPLTASQFAMNTNTYENLINWTVDGFNALKADPVYGTYNLRLIAMRNYSHENHALNGTGETWANSHYGQLNSDGSGRNGIAWHPNSACHEFIAEAIYNDLQNLGAPAY